MPSSLDGRNDYFAVWAIRKVKTLCLLGIGVEGLAFQRRDRKTTKAVGQRWARMQVRWVQL